MTPKKTLLGLAATALLLGGCATGPYYGDRYAYDDGRHYQRPVDPYYDPPVIRSYEPYYPYYYGPSVSFGLAFGNRGHWRRR